MEQGTYLDNCLGAGCGADRTWLRRISTFPLHGDEPTDNPVVVCAKCGTIMVKLGIVGGKRGWAVHPAIDRRDAKGNAL